MSINFAVRFSDNVSDLKKHLAEGLDQIEVTRAAVDKLARSLGGENVIKSAHNWTAALQELGGAGGALAGVQKLTAAETDRANAAIDRAVDKYTALGQAIPGPIAELQKLTNARVAEIAAADNAAKAELAAGKAAQQAATSTGALGSALAQLTAAFSVSSLLNQAVGSLVDFTKQAFASADSLVSLSNKTGLSTETIQRMQFVAKQSGSDMQQFADAAFKMGVNVSEGTKKARDGAEALGLDWAKLRAANPDDQFTMVVQALEKMEDPQKRNAAAVALFGKTAKDILPAIIDGYTKIAKEATVASDAQVRAVDAAGDAIDRWKARQVAAFTQTLGAFFLWRDAMNTLTLDEQRFIGETDKSIKSIDDMRLALIAAAQAKAKFGNISAPAAPGAKDIPLPPETKPISASFVADLKAAEAGYRALTGAQLADLDAAFRLGEGNEKIINQLNVTEGVLSIAKKAYEDHKSALAKAAEEQKKFAEAQEEARLATIPLTAAQQLQAASLLALDVNHKKIALDIGAGEVQVRLFAESLKDVDTNIAKSRTIGEEGAAAVSKAFAGPQTVLKDLLISTGAVPISLKSILAPAQQVGKVLNDVTKGAKEHFDELHDTLTGDITDIVETMRDLGVGTREDLQRTADVFKTLYDGMLASGKFTTDELIVAWQRYRTAQAAVQGDTLKTKLQFDALNGTLAGLAGVFGSLAHVGTGLFGTIATEMGQVVSAAQGLSKAMEQLTSSGKGGGFNVANLAALAAGWVGIFVAMLEVSEAIYDAQAATKALGAQFAISNQAAIDFSKTLQASLGTSAVSQGLLDNVQQFSATLGKSLQETLDQLNRVYANTVITQEMIAQGFAANSAGGVNLQRAEALNLSAIIAELGGVAHLTANQMASVGRQTGLLFDLIAKGGPMGVTALKALDDELMAFTTDLSHGGLVDKFFLDMAARAHAAGIELKQVADFMNGQAASAETGLSAALKVTNDAYARRTDLQGQIAALGTSSADAGKLADLNAQLKTQNDIISATAIHSQGASEAVAGGLVALINSQITAGKSFHDSVLAVAPAVDALSQQMIAAGFVGGDAFNALRAQVALATDEVAGPALTAVEGYGSALRGLNNAGLLTQDTFAGISSQIGHTRDALVAQGKDGGQVLSAMRGPLQTMWELEQKFGYTTDAATQELIDQAAAQGLVGEQFKPIGEQMLDATNRIADAVEGLAEVFGVLPKAARDAADGISDGLSHIRTPSIMIPITASGSGAPEHDPTATPPGFARGSDGIRDFGLGTSVVLHGREAVFTEPQVQAMTTGATRSSGGSTVVLQESFTFQVTLPPGGTTHSDYVEKDLMPQIIGQIEDRRRGFTGRLRRALEIPS